MPGMAVKPRGRKSRLKRERLVQKTAPPTPGGISRNGRLARHVLWVHAHAGSNPVSSTVAPCNDILGVFAIKQRNGPRRGYGAVTQWQKWSAIWPMSRVRFPPVPQGATIKEIFMPEDVFLKWCFRWWANRATFSLDNERSIRDNSANIPPRGWVT